MIKIRQVKIEVTKDNEEERIKAISKKLNVSINDIVSAEISKQSLDARDKENIYYVYEFICEVKNEDKLLLYKIRL